MTSGPQPISAECGLYLRHDQHGNEPRFSQLFSEVFQRLPSRDRDAILAHWSEHGRDERGRLYISIALENFSGLRNAEAVGKCEAYGLGLKFYARVIDMLPNDLVKYVIAHELAHVLQAVRGQRLIIEPHPLRKALAYAASPLEREADDIALRWGFDGRKLNRWLDRNVRWDKLPKDPY